MVGLSLGGGIAQYLALEHPQRVRTLCLASTSPWVPTQHAPTCPGRLLRSLRRSPNPDPEPDWTDRDAVIAYRVDAERPYAGSLGFDEPHIPAARHPGGGSNPGHGRLADQPLHPHHDPPTDARLDQITAPTLVLHGTTDPMFPIEHGEALAAEIPERGSCRFPASGTSNPHAGMGLGNHGHR